MPSTPIPRCRCTSAGSVVLHRLYEKNRANDNAPGDYEETMVIDPEVTPLLAQVTNEGHRIGAADEKNFEYGLECILDHAAQRIDANAQRSRRHLPGARPRPAEPRTLACCRTFSEFSDASQRSATSGTRPR